MHVHACTTFIAGPAGARADDVMTAALAALAGAPSTLSSFLVIGALTLLGSRLKKRATSAW